MAGSNAVAAKKKILALLQAADGLSGIRIDYAYLGRNVEREYLYGGKIHIDEGYLAFRKGARIPRLETATIGWTILVRDMESDPAAADERAVELGTVLEETLASNPTLGGVVLSAAITSADMDYGLDDDALTSVLDYEITVRSQLV